MTVNWIARSSPNVSYAHFRTERISLTAAIPLFAMSTYRNKHVSMRLLNGLQGSAGVEILSHL
jgi:hypothetical protein